MQPLIQITNQGPLSHDDVGAWSNLVSNFSQNNFVRLLDFVSPSLLLRLSRRVDVAKFFERTDEGIASELTMEDESACGIFLFALNNQKLFKLIETLTGCAEIGCFAGRVYRLEPNSHHYDSWHDDRLDGKRLIGLSINLSEEAFAGGVLEIRDKASGQVLSRVTNNEFGSTTIFRLGKDIEHRVTNVTGLVARTAFAGWFQATPHFSELFSGRLLNLNSHV